MHLRICSDRRLARFWALAGLVLAGLALSLPALAQRTGASATSTEQRVALVIGNAAYKDAPLANPVNDAVDMAKALGELGFKVILRRNADQRAMRQAIREFGSELRRAEVGLFFFAGHGLQVRGNNYLVPVGADIQNEADAEDLSVDSQFVLRTMEESQVKFSIVMMDACRNNPFARGFRSASRGLAQMNAATGSLIAFATAPGSVAADGSGRNGVYTKHLLASLRQSDTDIMKVLQRVRTGVLQETGGKQTPWESSSLVGEFLFRPDATSTATPIERMTAEPAAGTPAPAAVDPTTFELAFWDAIKNSTRPEEYQAYLARYPDGQFAELARARAQPPAPATAKSQSDTGGTRLGVDALTAKLDPAAGAAPAEARGKGKVVLLRESAFLYSARSPDLYVDGRMAGEIPSGRYLELELEAGVRNLALGLSDFPAATTIRLTVVAGATHFLGVTPRQGAWNLFTNTINPMPGYSPDPNIVNAGPFNLAVLAESTGRQLLKQIAGMR